MQSPRLADYNGELMAYNLLFNDFFLPLFPCDRFINFCELLRYIFYLKLISKCLSHFWTYDSNFLLLAGMSKVLEASYS